MTIPLIFDTDPGIDDAAAIAILLTNDDFEVRLITSVAGNCLLYTSIVINFATAMLFKASGVPDEHGHHHEQDLNAKTAYIHLLADAGVSVGVIIAGLLIQVTGWHVIDPIVSMIIGVIIAVTSWPVMKSTFNLALNGVPDNVNESDVLRYLSTHEGVEQLHDLHIWPLSTTEAAMTVQDVYKRQVTD